MTGLYLECTEKLYPTKIRKWGFAVAAEKRVRVTTRVDETTKNKANQVFDRLGLNMSSAIEIFLHQVVEDQDLPFVVGKQGEDSAD